MNSLLLKTPFPETTPEQTQYIHPMPEDKRLINRRQIWAANRFWMEMNNMKTKRYGNKSHHHWYSLLFMMKSFKIILQLIGMYDHGVRNAEDILLRSNILNFPNLPEDFAGFTILHLSDLHLDGMNGLEDRMLTALNDQPVDLCVLTGDFRTHLHGINSHIISKLKYMVESINSRYGFVGVLGNHDDCHMVNPLEKIGICMLINQSRFLEQGKDKIRIVGTDDVHYYFTDQALHALEYADKEFSILLVHSPELYKAAADMGVDLYLCGHTHAGQVCLPGGRPIITHLNRGRRFYRGNWRYNAMHGFTHAGVGTSGIPIRFNTKGEVVIHTLYSSDKTN